MDRGAWQAAAHGGHRELDMTESLSTYREGSFHCSKFTQRNTAQQWVRMRLITHNSMNECQKHFEQKKQTWKTTFCIIALVWDSRTDRANLRWPELEQWLEKPPERGASQVALLVKNPPAHAGDVRDMGSIPGWGRSSPVFLPGESHGQRSLEGPQGCIESGMAGATSHAGDGTVTTSSAGESWEGPPGIYTSKN